MRRAWRIMSALGVLLAASGIFLTVYLFVHVQDLREARLIDQAATSRLICERQEVVAMRSIDQKRRTIGIARRNIAAERASIDEARILRRLILGVRSRRHSNRRVLLRAARALSAQIVGRERRIRRHLAAIRQMRFGVGVLRREIREVDCLRLPANRPFKQ